MNMERFYREEDLFPKGIAAYEERPYGILFYNEQNRDSYDSNHALLYRHRIDDPAAMLEDILRFYLGKGIRPNLYGSAFDEGYFAEIGSVLSAHGFEHWSEPQRYMVLEAPSTLQPRPGINVQRVSRWREEYGSGIFEPAGEPWEIPVAKRALENDNTSFFVAVVEGRPVGMTYAHTAGSVCRVDYLLVAPEYRKMGVGRSLIACFVEHCRQTGIEACYLWPGDDSAERIYHEAGFRYVETRMADRATLRSE